MDSHFLCNVLQLSCYHSEITHVSISKMLVRVFFGER